MSCILPSSPTWESGLGSKDLLPQTLGSCGDTADTLPGMPMAHQSLRQPCWTAPYHLAVSPCVFLKGFSWMVQTGLKVLETGLCPKGQPSAKEDCRQTVVTCSAGCLRGFPQGPAQLHTMVVHPSACPCWLIWLLCLTYPTP